MTDDRPRETRDTGPAARHHCAAGSRHCRGRQKADGGWQPALVTTERGLCDPCIGAVTRACRELVGDWDNLTGAIGDRSVMAGEKVSGSREAPIPLNTAVLALRSTLSEWCEAALAMVCPRLNIEPRERQRARGFPIREYRVVLQAWNVLPSNMKLLLECPTEPVNVWNQAGDGWTIEEMDGVGIALRLHQSHNAVHTVLGDTNPRTRLTMPCPVLGCGAKTLGVNNGETDVDCTACGGRWPREQYNWLAGMLVADKKHESKKERKTMLEWVLAERDWKLSRFSKLAEVALTGEYEDKVIVNMLCELVG